MLYFFLDVKLNAKGRFASALDIGFFLCCRLFSPKTTQKERCPFWSFLLRKSNIKNLFQEKCASTI